MTAAVAARTRIHGTKWPSNNPKKLSVDFLSSDDALRLSAGELTVPAELVGVSPRDEQSADAAGVGVAKEAVDGTKGKMTAPKDVTDKIVGGLLYFFVRKFKLFFFCDGQRLHIY